MLPPRRQEIVVQINIDVAALQVQYELHERFITDLFCVLVINYQSRGRALEREERV